MSKRVEYREGLEVAEKFEEAGCPTHRVFCDEWDFARYAVTPRHSGWRRGPKKSCGCPIIFAYFAKRVGDGDRRCALPSRALQESAKDHKITSRGRSIPPFKKRRAGHPAITTKRNSIISLPLPSPF